MKPQTLLRALLVPTLIFALSACSASPSNQTGGAGGDADVREPESGGELRWGLSTELDSLDPYVAVGGDTKGIVIFNLFEGLVKPDTSGNLNPAVAESYEILQDGKVYEFKLRNGVKFHNGNEVTPQDVRYSFARALESKADLEGFDNVESVNVTDDGLITITLIEANTEFLTSLTNAIIPDGYTDQASKPIGTGPFAFESYTPQQELILVKHKDYWQPGLPQLDKVTIVYEADTNALLLSLQSGNVDGAGIAASDARVLDLNDFNVIERNSNAVQQLALNNDYGPLQDERVRQALNYAVDADEIIASAFDGYGTKVGSPIIPGLSKYYNAALANAYPTDVEKARQLLAEAGYPDGFDLEITVPSNYVVHVNTAQVIVNQLARAGINATIKQIDWPTWLSEVYDGRQYQATVISVGGASLSPKNELARYLSDAGHNFYNYTSPAFDTKYAAASTALDDAERVALYKEAQQIISDEAGNVYIQDITGLSALRKGFDGLESYPIYAVTDFSKIYQVG
jgi:peptide/nickel transport system substrate-binding protein